MAACVVRSVSASTGSTARRGRLIRGDGRRSRKRREVAGVGGATGGLCPGLSSSWSDRSLVRSGEVHCGREDKISGLREGMKKSGIRSGVRARDRREDLTPDMMTEAAGERGGARDLLDSEDSSEVLCL